ncbi:hypothetical protein H6F53_14895 [Trichocoleus sp. FACHB-832]|uniref:hypothetical protein n=1 Tax=Trichocoleus sp. FACHB-832 TaxID=2692875 RepID=UPI001686361D|nr:hypothetical protein [Trichocoleus sp. FACHB-832]MBD1906763.1 hypothetical protein [Trichocoleus sp. FACHB-832]
MIILCIQEIAAAKGLTLEELSQVSGVSLEVIQAYATTPIETLTEEVAANLRKLASKLDVVVLELVQPVGKREAFRLKILEMAQGKGLTLEELSHRSGVHPAVLVFYSTQSICKQKLDEPQHKKNLLDLCKALICSIEDLQIPADLSTTILRLNEKTKEKGLTLKELSVLTSLPYELIDLFATQPINMSTFIEDDNYIIKAGFPFNFTSSHSAFEVTSSNNNPINSSASQTRRPFSMCCVSCYLGLEECDCSKCKQI